MLESILYYLQIQSWFPTDNGVALPGIQPLLVFGLMVVAMFVRGTSLPSRGELVEQRLPLAPRAKRLWQPALLGTAVAVVALIVLPYDFRQALITSLLATIMCLSVVVITGFVGQISVVQLALAGISGFIDLAPRHRPRRRVPAGHADRRLRGDGGRPPRSASRRCACAGSAWRSSPWPPP